MEQTRAVGSLDENEMVVERVRSEFGFHRFHICEGAEEGSLVGRESGKGLGKFAAHEPHLLATGSERQLQHLSMSIGRGCAQFAHVAENHHLVRIFRLCKAVERCVHGREVGIVGINDEAVVLGLAIF